MVRKDDVLAISIGGGIGGNSNELVQNMAATRGIFFLVALGREAFAQTHYPRAYASAHAITNTHTHTH